MSASESLFLEAWKAGVELSINGDKLHYEAQTAPSRDLLNRLREHKPGLMRFLSCWIDTPYGQAKFWGFVDKDRCGIILRHQPDRMTWIKRSELTVKPNVEDKQAVLQ